MLLELIAGIQTGIVAGIIFAIAAVVIHLLPGYRWIAAGLLLAVITPLALSGFWWSAQRWGISDWDYYFSLHEAHRRIIVDHGQFPWWNPMTCGGSAGLADPEFSVLTPTFLFELAFGVPSGLRLAIYFSVIFGSWGMLALCRRLRLSPLAGLLAAAAYAFGSVNLLEIVEGHVNIFAAMYLPWILWSWLAAYITKSPHFAPSGASRGKKIIPHKYELICSLFLALTFYQGGIYLLMYTALAFLFLPLFVRHRQRAYLMTLGIGAIALGVSAFKLLPVIFWLRQFQDTAYASSTTTLPYLYDILLGRHLHGTEVLPNQGSGWHEYGAYLGPVVIGLALLGAFFTFTKSRLTKTLVVAALIAILVSSSGPLLKPFFDSAPFIPRSNISRVILFAVIPLCLLAAIGVDRVKRLPKVGLIVACLLVGLAAIDVMSLANSLSQQAFIVPPNYPPPSPAPTPLAFTTLTYPTRIAGVDYTRSYSATLAGYGPLNYCTSIGPTPAVRTIHDEEDNEIVIIKADNASIDTLDWSPEVVTVRGSTLTATEVILNTNFADGWLANGQPAKNIDGRVGSEVEPGSFAVTFAYRAPGATTGRIITIATILFIGGSLFYSRRS